MIVVLDHHDSFTHNLVHGIEVAGAEVRVLQAEGSDLRDVAALRPEAVVLSPGPGHPDDAHLALEVVRCWGAIVPIFGLCLGHQVIARAFGGRVERCPEPVHGKQSLCDHHGLSWFEGLPNPLLVARYHSLVVERSSLPDVLEPLAVARTGELMAMRHRSFPIQSVQFHPESALMPDGAHLLAAFVRWVSTHRVRWGDDGQPH